VTADDFPLMRHLYEVIALERPLAVPWERFFGNEPTTSAAA
jgi:glycerol-3-phosphate dehydrogenase (NAD(P)+)